MPKPLTIAIETSGRAGSAAIGRGATLFEEVFFSGFMRHSVELFGVLETLLERADATAQQIERCCITAGPGSFTGLRIAVTVAKMLSLTHNAQIVAADTMDVLAENTDTSPNPDDSYPDCVATILDAKKNLFYAAVFDRVEEGWKQCFPTQTVTAEQLLSWLEAHHKKNVGLLGEGLVYYAEEFHSPFTTLLDRSLWSGRASSLFRVGQRMAAAGLFADPLTLKPKYLRQADAMVKKLSRWKGICSLVFRNRWESFLRIFIDGPPYNEHIIFIPLNAIITD